MRCTREHTTATSDTGSNRRSEPAAKTSRFAFEIRLDGETEWNRIEVEAVNLKQAEIWVACISNLYGYRVIG